MLLQDHPSLKDGRDPEASWVTSWLCNPGQIPPLVSISCLCKREGHGAGGGGGVIKLKEQRRRGRVGASA